MSTPDWNQILAQRLAMVSFLALGALAADGFVESVIWPSASAQLALRQLDSEAGARSLRLASTIHAAFPLVLWAIVSIAGLALLGPLLVSRPRGEAATHASHTRVLGLAGLMLVLFLSAGCRPYDRPEFEEIDTSETGFLIPLEGAVESQVAFESESYLAQRRVAAKRVQIPHRWVQTGRMHWTGEWIDTVRLIKVDRSPVTREWTADTESGTKRANEAIWIESKDSVGFSVGFNCTGFIEEENTARFLYMYRSRSLADTMDSELRARIQSIAAETAARYDLDELRSLKQEMIDDVRADIVPFFAERGITITTVGMFGGFTYQNPQIQEAIDATFVAQQKKVVNEALFDAQSKENERIELEAEGLANRVRAVAEGEADAIRMLAEATREAQSDPLFVQLKQLEVERDRIEKWNGEYPAYLLQMDSSESPSMMLELPAQTAHVRHDQ